MAGIFWWLLLRAYYYAKPAMPDGIRLALRRWLVRRKRKSCGEQWPILESAGVAPKGWTGWPNNQQFALVLTHDVESKRGLDRVKPLAELEMSLGFRSLFNFVPEGAYRDPEELRYWLTDRGFEVGVHDHRHDGKLYNSHSHFRASAERINHFLLKWKAVGFRSAFMLHNLEWIRELNIQYDCSTFDTDPFEPQPDGAKTIFPFWVAGRKGDGGGYVELPYTLVQDSTLFLFLQEHSIQIWKQKVQWIASRGGMVLLNVHPDYTALGKGPPNQREYPLALYEEFLIWVKQTYSGQYWHALPKDIAAFYRETQRNPSDFKETSESVEHINSVKPSLLKSGIESLEAEHSGGFREGVMNKGVNPEWHLDKAQNFLGEAFASARVGSGSEDDLA